MVVPAQIKIRVKQGATFGVAVILAVIYGMIADAVNLNAILFPWVSSWTLRSKVDAAVCSSVFFLVLGLVAWGRINISRQDVTYER